jgi:hypothetical protein
MDLVFQAHAELRPTENHIKQLHQRELVELCRIQRFGKARATWYRLAQLPFQGS